MYLFTLGVNYCKFNSVCIAIITVKCRRVCVCVTVHKVYEIYAPNSQARTNMQLVPQYSRFSGNGNRIVRLT